MLLSNKTNDHTVSTHSNKQPNKKKKNVRVTVYMSTKLQNKLKLTAVKKHIDASKLMRIALRQYFDNCHND